MSPRAWLGVAVVAAVLGLPPLYLRGLDGAALYDGDEAIYAEMAREQTARGEWAELRFDGAPVFPRPPAAVWAIRVAAVVAPTPVERPVRVANAALSALAVALTIVLGALLFGPAAGVLAGALLGVSDLFVGYARVYESEPLLLCCVLLALCGWARRSTAGWLVFGVGLGGALLTKQLVGLLPLLGPLVDHACARRGGGRPSGRGLLVGLGVALAIAAPWHLVMIARHGSAFVDAYLVRSVLSRGAAPLLHRTAPWFYLAELWSSERPPFAVAFLASALAALALGLRRGRRAELLVGAWALGVLVVYSLARSRYDYYLLLAYPAFALALAWALAATRVSVAGGALVVVASAALHLPRNLTPQRGDEDVRTLMAAIATEAPGAPVYTLGHQPYTARFYGQRPVRVFVESERDRDAATALRATGMPAPAVLAVPAARAIELAARPSFLVYPRARQDLLAGVPPERYRVVGDAGRLRALMLP